MVEVTNALQPLPQRQLRIVPIDLVKEIGATASGLRRKSLLDQLCNDLLGGERTPLGDLNRASRQAFRPARGQPSISASSSGAVSSATGLARERMHPLPEATPRLP